MAMVHNHVSVMVHDQVSMQYVSVMVHDHVSVHHVSVMVHDHVSVQYCCNLLHSPYLIINIGINPDLDSSILDELNYAGGQHLSRLLEPRSK